ncbi:hypothetical protein [Tropicibacter sp. Alg240-R139]|uniref:hypothetical protein n=1 Tax=Tropicibacter sp. Alg240-R139 TaxID=2305991 RepID=UPI0013DFC468|nr:hypothetical protein [Tropicibacter sp. Alg240-R139]
MIIRTLRFSAKSVFALLLVASIALNIATVTISGVYSAVSGAASAVGLSTVAAREVGEKLTRRKAAQKAVRRTSSRVTQRMAKGAARNTATAFGEAIPLIGVAVIAGGLALEVQDACDTARDMAGLEGVISDPDNPEEAQKKAMEEFECSELIPEAEGLPSIEDIWGGMLSAPGKAWDAAAEYVDELPEIDLSGYTEQLVIAAGKRMEGFLDWWSGE